MNKKQLEEKLKELILRGNELGLTKEKLLEIDNEIENVSMEIDKLQKKKDEFDSQKKIIQEHLSEITKLEIEIKKNNDIENDISIEEFVDKISHKFIECSNNLNSNIDDVEEESHVRTILLMIENMIITPLYELNDYKNIVAHDLNPEQIHTLKSDIIYGRYWAVQKLLQKILNPMNFAGELNLKTGRFLGTNYETYNEILKEIDEMSWCCSGAIGEFYKSNQMILNVDIAKILYEKLLIPYYKKIGIPFKLDQNQLEKPYLLLIYDGYGDEEENSEEILKNYYDSVKLIKEYYNSKGAGIINDNSNQRYLEEYCAGEMIVPALGMAPEEVKYFDLFMDYWRNERKNKVV